MSVNQLDGASRATLYLEMLDRRMTALNTRLWESIGERTIFLVKPLLEAEVSSIKQCLANSSVLIVGLVDPNEQALHMRIQDTFGRVIRYNIDEAVQIVSHIGELTQHFETSLNAVQTAIDEQKRTGNRSEGVLMHWLPEMEALKQACRLQYLPFLSMCGPYDTTLHARIIEVSANVLNYDVATDFHSQGGSSKRKRCQNDQDDRLDTQRRQPRDREAGHHPPGRPNKRKASQEVEDPRSFQKLKT